MVGNLKEPVGSLMLRFAADFDLHVATFGPGREIPGVGVHSLGAGLGPIRRRLAGLKMFRRVLKEARPELIQVHQANLRFLTGRLPRATPVVASVVGGDIMPDQTYRGLAKRRTDWLLHRADVITGHSPFLVRRVSEMGFGGKARLLNYGVGPPFPMDRGQARQVAAGLGVDLDRPFFLSVRSADPIYDTLGILQAFGRLAQAEKSSRLLIPPGHGAGGYWQQVERTVRDLGLGERVTLLPLLTLEQMAALVRLCRAAVSVPFSDGLAQSFMEARVSGTLLIMTGLPQYDGLIRPGYDALTVPPGDPEALAKAMLQALEDDALAARAGEAAHQARRDYDFEAGTDRFRQLYQELLAGKRK